MVIHPCLSFLSCVSLLVIGTLATLPDVSPTSLEPRSCSGPQTHTIKVAPNSMLVFEPNFITIALGDTVKWVFVGSKNHTVTRSLNNTFCPSSPPSNTSISDMNMFDSGLLMAPSDFQVTPTEVGIMDYICAIPAHCNAGMRGSIQVTHRQASCPMMSTTTPSCTKQVKPTHVAMTRSTSHVVCPPCHPMTVSVTSTTTCFSTVISTYTLKETITATHNAISTPTPTPSSQCSCDCCSSVQTMMLSPPKRHEIKVAPNSNLIFDPKDLEIQLGDTIRWVFVGTKNHTVTQVANANASCPDTPYTNKSYGKTMSMFDSGLLSSPSIFDFTPTRMGTLDYICGIPAHCKAGMRGFIRVKAHTLTESCPCAASCCPSSPLMKMPVISHSPQHACQMNPGSAPSPVTTQETEHSMTDVSGQEVANMYGDLFRQKNDSKQQLNITGTQSNAKDSYTMSAKTVPAVTEGPTASVSSVSTNETSQAQALSLSSDQMKDRSWRLTALLGIFTLFVILIFV